MLDSSAATECLLNVLLCLSVRTMCFCEDKHLSWALFSTILWWLDFENRGRTKGGYSWNWISVFLQLS